MLEVSVRLLSSREPTGREIAAVRIINDGSGDAATGNYDVVVRTFPDWASAEAPLEEYVRVEGFWERLDEDATPTVTLELGDPHGRVQFQRRETIRTRIIDKDAAAKAIREAGYDYMLEPVGFRKRPLNQHVRECLRSGAELFDGVDFSRTKYVQISRR